MKDEDDDDDEDRIDIFNLLMKFLRKLIKDVFIFSNNEFVTDMFLYNNRLFVL